MNRRNKNIPIEREYKSSLPDSYLIILPYVVFNDKKTTKMYILSMCRKNRPRREN